MRTYKQDIKEKSRKLLWEHAINSLTTSRFQNTICTPEIINEFTNHCLNTAESLLSKDEIFNQIAKNQEWIDFHQSVYNHKNPKDIKVAYFCGPEPKNDLLHLFSRGIQPQNIWAFELGKENYKNAKKEIIELGTYINLFEGDIADFINTYPQKFDIVFLDFTNHLISKKNNPALLVNSLFEMNFLSDLSCVITNTCYPDESEDHIDFLSMYHQFRQWTHRSLWGDKDGGMFRESFESHGLISLEEIKGQIEENFKDAYSNYSSAFPDIYCNIINPILKILRLPTIRKKLFNSTNLEEALYRLSRTDLQNYGEEENLRGFDLIFSPTNYSDWHFAENLIKKRINPFSQYLSNKVPPKKNYSPFDAIKLFSLITSIEEGYFDAFSEDFLEIVSKIQKYTIETRTGNKFFAVFCDVPMKHLWYMLLVGKYGHPYHINYRNHKRYEYKAKERSMCLDLFTFDKCRSLYDWIPSFEFIPNMFKDVNSQLIIRSYIDIIYKTQFYYNDSTFSWGHVIPFRETPNAEVIEINDRIIIK